MRTVNEILAELVGTIRAEAQEELFNTLKGTFKGPKSPAFQQASKDLKSRNYHGRRDPADIEALTARLLEHVKNNPGQRAIDAAAALGVTPKDLSLPYRKLLASKRLKTKGTKGTTTYTAA